MSLIPFYGMHHQHYMVYWDLFTTEEWKDMQEAYKNELKRLQDLDKITVDYVTLGEMQEIIISVGRVLVMVFRTGKSGERPGLVVGLNLI